MGSRMVGGWSLRSRNRVLSGNPQEPCFLDPSGGLSSSRSRGSRGGRSGGSGGISGNGGSSRAKQDLTLASFFTSLLVIIPFLRRAQFEPQSHQAAMTNFHLRLLRRRARHSRNLKSHL